MDEDQNKAPANGDQPAEGENAPATDAPAGDAPTGEAPANGDQPAA